MVRHCKPSACPLMTRSLFLSIMRADMLYRLAHAAAIKPAGPAPMMRRSVEEYFEGSIYARVDDGDIVVNDGDIADSVRGW